MQKTYRHFGLAVFLATLAGLARAHGGDLGSEHGVSFWAGFVHPFAGLDHLTAMLAVGLWGAVSSHRPWVAPLAFANMLILGAVLAMSGYVVPMVEPLVAATLLALGLLVATRARMPEVVAASLAGGFAVLHGMAHGSEMSTAVSSSAVVVALMGVVAATVLLHAVGMVAGLVLRERALGWTRAAGAVVAMAGGALLMQLA